MDSVFQLKGISKTFPKLIGEAVQTGRKNVLSDVSINLNRGEIYGFVGLNGAGKTTCIKIALGLAKADQGEITWFGNPISNVDFAKIGFTPEKPSFYEFLTGEEVLDFGARLLGLSPNQARKKEVLSLTGLWGDHQKRVGSFSKGMQQRLALAAAMLHEPEVYILDEPSSGLDPLGRKMIKNLIKDLQKNGKSIFFSTHILADVHEICDRIGVIHQGKMIFEGTLSSFNSNNTDLEKRFVELIGVENASGNEIGK
ncbi:MAG: ABC transporter ATP-binding protein [Candidatus Riflebacteria bacterium]|nr:ABC transporter ATP-binding protein [Candidatus Riflebacteria bacterium]